MRMRFMSAAVLGLFCLVAAPSVQAQDWEAVEIGTTEVAPGVYMLTGSGGNIGVSVGEDGVFLIDDQYAPLTDKIVAAIREISDGPIRFVLNTHWHGDHTGGNENLGGVGALIVAHDNVRKRMSVDQLIEAYDMKVEASPEGALPVVTFSEAVTFHLNGGELYAFHVEHSHTDGDAIVHFRDANVVHAGDTYFNDIYPFIDVSSGGSVDGMIESARKMLAIVDDDTQIIPGHGALSGKAELEEFLEMLLDVRQAVAALVAEGKSREEVIAAHPSEAWDNEWADGWLNPEQFVGSVYDSLAR